VKSDSPRAFSLVARHHQREHARSSECRADTLHDPRNDQDGRRLREAADQRGDDENPEPDSKGADLPDKVAQPAAKQQQSTERQTERVRNPGQSGCAEAEIRLDPRQRDDDDQEVHREHQLCREDCP
jgi:hypothetical protein